MPLLAVDAVNYNIHARFEQNARDLGQVDMGVYISVRQPG
jgi:hypothetical protein